MAYFHYRCGERITLTNDNCTAVRNDSDFDHGLVITAEPLANDVLFEIKIDRKVNSWSGSLEVGVVDCDPLHFDFPACASKIQSGSWIMSASSIFRNGVCLIEGYGPDLDKLNQDDRVGLMRTSEGDLIFFFNGESQGVAAEGLPEVVYAIIDIYGKCVQITITSPPLREHNNDDCLSGSSVLAIDNDILNVTLGGDLSELSLSSSNSLDIRMDMNVSLSLPEESSRFEGLRFHDRSGSMIKLSNGCRVAERRRPQDEFNNGVVMTNRAIRDNELFEIRIDRLCDKWSGSLESQGVIAGDKTWSVWMIGVTTYTPSSLLFPATMTNMCNGTVMMSGCGVMTNGKGTIREYAEFSLDELSEGDRVGLMRKPNGNLHFYINGVDQGIAHHRIPPSVWGVVDLYGMTTKVTIVERDEREEQNLVTRKANRDEPAPVLEPQLMQEYYDRLTFHQNCGTHAQVINNGRTARRPHAAEDFNNGVVLTTRPVKTGELFEVRLDRVVTKWAGSIEIGVTTHSPIELDFPFTMTNVRSGTWMMTGAGIMHNGTIVMEQYGMNLDRLQVGDRVGVVRKENGCLHFFVNSVDQGVAALNVPERIFGVIDLYGQAVEATIVDIYDYASPDTIHSSLATLFSDLRFHHVHGKNAKVVNNGLTAIRPRPLAEFNDAIVFSNRPLRDGELFEVVLESIVDRWSGSVELGVTAVKPDDIELPNTATDFIRDTWMLSGSSIMENGKTIKNNYPLDLDNIGAGTRLGVMRMTDKTLEFFKDGIPQGTACFIPHPNVYAIVDLYGQCAQVSIPGLFPLAPLASAGMDVCPRSETSASLQATSGIQPPIEIDFHRYSEFHGNGVILSEGGRMCTRIKDLNSCVVYSATPLVQDEVFEISIASLLPHLSGTLSIGVTTISPATCTSAIPNDCCYLTGNELRYKNKLLQLFTPSLQWLNTGDRIGFIRPQDGPVKVFINGEELPLCIPTLPDCLYVVMDIKGSCSSIHVISHRASISPLNCMRLQDSLELVIDQEPSLSENKDNSSQETTCSVSSVIYEFHENHGRNIELFNRKTSARRVASYNQGMVIVQPPLEPLTMVQVIVEHIQMQWQSSIIVGLVASQPDRLNLPVNALSIKGPCCIVANDWISINGVKSRSTYGQNLNNLKVGDCIGVILTETRQFKLSINNVEQEGIVWTFPVGQPVYALFDLYGQCQQIRIVNNVAVDDKTPTSVDCEKADLEVYEKERSENRLTLPIPSASTSVPTTTPKKNTPTTPYNPLTCSYKEECEKFKKRLLLPDQFFASELPACYCIHCSKAKSHPEDKDNPIQGWVKFPLRNMVNITTEKWHNAFYPCKMGAIRCILDKGQPLTKGQMQFCNIISKKDDDLQVVFYPTLENCFTMGYKSEDKEYHAAFQILVKPDAYSVSRDNIEWSTKEAGAIKFQALLMNVRPL